MAKPNHKTAQQNFANNWKAVGLAVQKKIAGTPDHTFGMPAGTPGGGGTTAGGPEKPPVAPYDPTHDSIYNTSIGNIDTNTKNLLGSLVGTGTGLEADYGIDGPAFDPTTYDPAHPTAGFSIDENVDVKNPFSRAALLKKSYQQSARGDSNSMAARGQLYSGAFQNAQNADTSNFNQGTDTLLKDFGSKFGGLYGQWLANNTTATGQKLQAGTDAFNRYQTGVANGTITPVEPYGTVDPRPTPGFKPDPNYNGNPDGLVPVVTGPGKGLAQPTTGTVKPKPVKAPKPKAPKGTLVLVKGKK